MSVTTLPARSAQYLVEDLHRAITDAETCLARLPRLVVKAIDDRVWEEPRRAGGTTLPPSTFKEFVEAPFPHGLDNDVADLDLLLSFCRPDESAEIARDALAAEAPAQTWGPHGTRGRKELVGLIAKVATEIGDVNPHPEDYPLFAYHLGKHVGKAALRRAAERLMAYADEMSEPIGTAVPFDDLPF